MLRKVKLAGTGGWVVLNTEAVAYAKAVPGTAASSNPTTRVYLWIDQRAHGIIAMETHFEVEGDLDTVLAALSP